MERTNRIPAGPGRNFGRGGQRASFKEMCQMLKRVLRYMTENYKWSFIAVVLCIFGSSLATRRGTLFMQTLIDDYIVPLTQAASPDYGPLARVLAVMACIFGAGILCSFAYTRIMVNVSQGTMKRLRTELFSHMQSLPVRYFDTHSHGDIMSVYTNDVDTLRQLISQSIPQVINAAITLVTTLVSLIILDIPLTIVCLFMVGLMAFSTSRLSGRSGMYFSRQQKDLGQHHDALKRQPGKYLLRPLRRHRSHTGPGRVLRADPGRTGFLPDAVQELYPAGDPAQPADEQHRHGHRRSRAYFPDDG